MEVLLDGNLAGIITACCQEDSTDPVGENLEDRYRVADIGRVSIEDVDPWW